MQTHRDLLHRLALAANCAILAIDYRRPPEYPCPAAIDDVLRVYRWLLAEMVSLPSLLDFSGSKWAQ